MARPSVTESAGYANRFRILLLGWFQEQQRKLPWRGESDPYRILVSEIMLQQTRVAVVEERYRKFIAQFPSAERLARARAQTVLAAWSGLGYYRRARNLHLAAKEIARAGEFPQTAEKLRELPGVGRYTANAVASIAFGEPVPVVDGNVKRVLERITGRALGEEHYWQTAELLLDRSSAGDFNQGLMELGAVVCLPGKPLCAACPVSPLCAARGPMKKGERPARRKAELHYAFVRRNGSVLLQQRDKESPLMPGMWELPQIAAKKRDTAHLLKLRHSITTTDYTVFVHAVHAGTESAGSGRWVELRSVFRLPLTGLARKILKEFDDD